VPDDSAAAEPELLGVALGDDVKAWTEAEAIALGVLPFRGVAQTAAARQDRRRPSA